jgi:hypothetical protein
MNPSCFSPLATRHSPLPFNPLPRRGRPRIS